VRHALLAVVLLAPCGAEAAAAESPYGPESVPRSVAELAHRDAWVRWHAAYALGQAGPKAGAAVGPLAKVLENLAEEEYVRGAAAWALGRIGPPAAAGAVPLLTRTLASQHVSVRRNAAEALGQFGRAARGGVADIEKLLSDPDAVARVEAAAALWKIDRSPRAVPSLLRSLDSGGPGACRAAAVLGELDFEPDRVVPGLMGSLGQGDDDVRRAAMRALERIGPKTVPALGAALKDKNAAVRRWAAWTLGRIGPGARPAQQALAEAASDADPQVRQSAAWALGRVGGP
jgi:HEAT repeat protein